MVIQLPAPGHRRALVAFAALLFCFLAFFSVRNALATYSTSLLTQAGFERAVRLEPSNPQNWYLLGRYWQYNLENPDAARAIKSYRSALALDPRSSDVYVDLAAAFEAEDDPNSAAAAFLNAKQQYPASAEVAWRYGNFLLRQGNVTAAFAEIRRAVAADPLRAGEALSRCLRVEAGQSAVLDRVIPPSAIAYLAILRDFSAPDQLPLALEVWNRIAALHPRISILDVFSLVNNLRQQGRTSEAWRVWQEAAPLAGLADLKQPPGSLVWDGGFETGVKDFGYAWVYDANLRAVQFQLDRQEKHSGSASLRIGFDGESNVNFLSPCHVVPVEPTVKYRLSAWIQSRSLATKEGVHFVLRSFSDPSAALVTPEVHGTHPWTLITGEWLAPAGAQEAQLCVARQASDDPDDKVRGTFWVDDVSIAPERGTSRQ